MSRIIVIVGPTASGKTKVSIELAKYLKAEIINADAVQIYKDINIGTAKITKKEMENITHHMIDFNPLSNKYTLYNYQNEARKVLDNLIKQNKNIIIVGGTGLYIASLLYNYQINAEEKIDLKKYDKFTNQELKDKINKIYPNNIIHVNNRHRLLRFISHYDNTSEIIKNTNNKKQPLYNFKMTGLKVNRKELYERINKRVDEMIKSGLIKEARKLYEKNINTKAFIGYKELNKYFRNEISLEKAVEEIKKNTRHYAKRQYTWFLNQFENIQWVDVDYKDFNNTISKIKKIIKE